METEKASKPEYLPDVCWLICQVMRQRQKLDGRSEAFFIDARLKNFWQMASKYLLQINTSLRENAAGFLVGSFINPLGMYSATGTVDRPTIKVNIRNAQKDADKLFDEIADLAEQLADRLELVESTTKYSPCELHLIDLLEPLLGDNSINEDINYRRIRTVQLIDLLAARFRGYPRTDTIFSEVPGMSSQKSSWRDWLAEVRHNLELMLDTYPGDFEMKEVYWVNLVNVLIDENIGRTSVQAALKDH